MKLLIIPLDTASFKDCFMLSPAGMTSNREYSWPWARWSVSASAVEMICHDFSLCCSLMLGRQTCDAVVLLVVVPAALPVHQKDP